MREIAFRPKDVGNHDYLRVPEIVEDICRVSSVVLQVDPLPSFIAATRPCIVKFVDTGWRADLITTPLCYLYCTFRGEALSMDCNTCLDRKGEAVAPQDIQKIEVVAES